MPGPPALGPTALACPAPRPALLAARVAIIGWSPPTRSPPGSSHGSHVGLTHMPAPQKAGHSSRSATPCILNHTELYLNSPGHVLFCFVFLSVSPPEQSLQHPQRWHRGGVQKLGVKPLLLQLWLLAGAAQQPSQTPVTGEVADATVPSHPRADCLRRTCVGAKKATASSHTDQIRGSGQGVPTFQALFLANWGLLRFPSPEFQ